MVKTRKFGGKVYKNISHCTTKTDAKNAAEHYRSRGKSARIIKEKGWYAVYVR